MFVPPVRLDDRPHTSGTGPTFIASCGDGVKHQASLAARFDRASRQTGVLLDRPRGVGHNPRVLSQNLSRQIVVRAQGAIPCVSIEGGTPLNHFVYKGALLLVAMPAMLVWLACPPNSNQNQGDITIQQSDATPPTISLQVAVVGGNSTTSVSSGGSPATLSLTSKAVTLNIAATAKDPESGIQAFEIDIGNSLTVTCQASGTCTQSGPGNVSPMWTSNNSQLHPGDRAVSSSIMLESLIPSATGLLHPAAVAPAGGTLTESFTVSAKARNQLGGTSSTPDLTVRSKLP